MTKDRYEWLKIQEQKNFHSSAMTLQRPMQHWVPVAEDPCGFQGRWSLWSNDDEANPNKKVQA